MKKMYQVVLPVNRIIITQIIAENEVEAYKLAKKVYLEGVPDTDAFHNFGEFDSSLIEDFSDEWEQEELNEMYNNATYKI